MLVSPVSLFDAAADLRRRAPKSGSGKKTRERARLAVGRAPAAGAESPRYPVWLLRLESWLGARVE